MADVRSGIPVKGLSVCDAVDTGVDQMPVFPAALTHSCTAVLKEAECSC